MELTVSLNNIYKNCQVVKKRLNENVKLCGVVKCDAYGHGMQKTALKLAGLCDYFAVATAQEAFELRNTLTNKEILLMGGFDNEDLIRLLYDKINLTVFNSKTLLSLNDFAKEHNRKFFVHIKYDCGMNRLGFKTDEEGLDILNALNKCQNIVLAGLYTHFASGDIKDRAFLLNCKKRFDKQALLFKNFKNDILIHAAATSTAFLNLGLQYDMVRCGLGLYGYNANDDFETHLKLKPSIELKAKILQVKDVKKFETVGYGRNFTANKDMKIAAICCGYGDGYNRLLSNSGFVVIDNKLCKICGNICMDLCMADCTDCKKCKEALLISDKNFKKYIGLEKIAENNNTIIYEVLTSLAKRCKREYIDD